MAMKYPELARYRITEGAADVNEPAPEVEIPPLHELRTKDPEAYKQLRDGFLGRFLSHDQRAAGSSPFNRGG